MNKDLVYSETITDDTVEYKFHCPFGTAYIRQVKEQDGNWIKPYCELWFALITSLDAFMVVQAMVTVAQNHMDLVCAEIRQQPATGFDEYKPVRFKNYYK